MSGRQNNGANDPSPIGRSYLAERLPHVASSDPVTLVLLTNDYDGSDAARRFDRELAENPASRSGSVDFWNAAEPQHVIAIDMTRDQADAMLSRHHDFMVDDDSGYGLLVVDAQRKVTDLLDARPADETPQDRAFNKSLLSTLYPTEFGSAPRAYPGPGRIRFGEADIEVPGIVDAERRQGIAAQAAALRSAGQAMPKGSPEPEVLAAMARRNSKEL